MGVAFEDVEAQARVAVYARAKGFSGACTAYALRGKPATFAYARPSDGTPCLLLSWVDGMAADKVIEQGIMGRKLWIFDLLAMRSSRLSGSCATHSLTGGVYLRHVVQGLEYIVEG